VFLGLSVPQTKENIFSLGNGILTKYKHNVCLESKFADGV